MMSRRSGGSAGGFSGEPLIPARLRAPRRGDTQDAICLTRLSATSRDVTVLAPAVASSTEIGVRLTVRDPRLASSQDSIRVTVLPVGNRIGVLVNDEIGAGQRNRVAHTGIAAADRNDVVGIVRDDPARAAIRSRCRARVALRQSVARSKERLECRGVRSRDLLPRHADAGERRRRKAEKSPPRRR